MKKFLIVYFLFSICASFVKAEEIIITKPNWQSVAPVSYQNVKYIEPINRPKWATVLSWVGYAGTLFLVPFPFINEGKDNKIRKNNNWVKFKEDFEKELNDCEKIYKQDEELYKCYQNVQNKYIQFLNMQLTDERPSTTIINQYHTSPL